MTTKTGPLVVARTLYCARPPHYEIWLAGGDDPEGNALVFRTYDRALYDDALDAEDTPQRFIAHWHADRSVRILDRLQPAELLTP